MRIKRFFFVSICLLIFSTASLVAQNLGTDLTYYGFTEYDENGNKIYGKTFMGQEYFYEYNDDGKLSFWLNIDSKWGDETACSIEYDTKGRIIHEDYGYEEYTYEYDEENYTVQQKYRDGSLGWKYDCDTKWQRIHGKRGVMEWWAYFDSNGNETYNKDWQGIEIKYEYDSKGRLIHEISNNSGEFWYEYTFWDNGNVKLQKMYLVRTEETVG